MQKPPNISGIWAGKYFFSSILATVKQQQEQISGHVEVSSFLGAKDVYHYIGNINGRTIKASHHNGRIFEGQLIGTNKIYGALTLRNGVTINIKATKIS